MGQVTVISGAERRRFWSDEQKLALIEAAFAPGAKVARVAAQADLRPSQIYRWRRDLLGSQSMVPVVVTGHSSEPVAEPVIVIEVQDATVRIMPDASAALINAALRALRR
jgi:transposase